MNDCTMTRKVPIACIGYQSKFIFFMKISSGTQLVKAERVGTWQRWWRASAGPQS